MSSGRLLDLGKRDYRAVLELQRSLHQRIRDGIDPETWIFVEHPAVVTLGRRANAANVLLSREILAARGIDIVEIERGGDVTYHGPGQLVVYPIRKLARFREVVPLVRALEAAAIRVCAGFDVDADRWDEHAGVWVGVNQICAVGLAVQKMTSLHGIALNVCTDLSYDQLITPCGLPDRGVTSLSKETGRRMSLSEVKPALIASLSREFDVQFENMNTPAPQALSA